MKTEDIQNWLACRIAKEAGIDSATIDPKAPLLGYFLNGFQSSRIVPELERYLGRVMPEAVLYERPTIAELAEFLSERAAGDSRKWAILRPLARVWEP